MTYTVLPHPVWGRGARSVEETETDPIGLGSGVFVWAEKEKKSRFVLCPRRITAYCIWDGVQAGPPAGILPIKRHFLVCLCLPSTYFTNV